MADEEQLKVIKQGVDFWNQWRNKNPEVSVDLSQADLRGAKLAKVHLKNADLKGVKLQFADLNGADLESANLKNAKLQEVNLQRASLRNAKLAGASLLESNLQYADLENADLQGAQLNEDALLTETILRGANLSGATGLTSMQIKSAFTDDQTKLPDYLEDEAEDDFLLQM